MVLLGYHMLVQKMQRSYPSPPPTSLAQPLLPSPVWVSQRASRPPAGEESGPAWPYLGFCWLGEYCLLSRGWVWWVVCKVWTVDKTPIFTVTPSDGVKSCPDGSDTLRVGFSLPRVPIKEGDSHTNWAKPAGLKITPFAPQGTSSGHQGQSSRRRSGIGHVIP